MASAIAGNNQLIPRVRAVLPSDLPRAELRSTIENSFSSLNQFRHDFADAATSQFGSGWGWLVLDGGLGPVLSDGGRPQ